MKTLISLMLASTLAACGGDAPPLPDGVTCSDEAMDSVNVVPPKANPTEDEYSEIYAIGWYIGHGCQPPEDWGD